jgi:hypothetical protein
MKFILIVSFIVTIFLSDLIIAQQFQTGEIGIVLSNYGRVRVHKDSVAGLREIDRSSFMAAVDTDFVFSYWLSAAVHDSAKTVLNPAISDHELYCSIDNSFDTSGHSPDFLVKHNIYGWNNNAYVLVKFTVLNREASAQNTTLGMEIISQIDGSYGLETVYWMAAEKIVAQFRPPSSTYIGYKILSAETNSVRLIDWYEGYNESNFDLYNWLTYNQIDTMFESGGDGAVAFFSQDFVNIASADSAIMWVAISLGENETEMASNMALAETRYNTITDVKDNLSNLPSGYQLYQNYPNPFNPATAIRFSIPQQGFVSLKIYDVLGNEIADLVHQTMNAGDYSVTFSRNDLPSGIYFYRLTSGNHSETKKMNLLK